MKTLRVIGIMSALLFLHCTHNTAPEMKDIARLAPHELGSGALQIQTEREAYSWSTSALRTHRLIAATLTNTSEQTFYAKLGDGFAGEEQEQLHIAAGAHGHIEQWQQSPGWREMPRSHLIEGVRYVVLAPKRSYQLHADLFQWQGEEVGEFRLRVEYFARVDPPDSATPRVDISNVFVIAQ